FVESGTPESALLRDLRLRFPSANYRLHAPGEVVLDLGVTQRHKLIEGPGLVPFDVTRAPEVLRADGARFRDRPRALLNHAETVAVDDLGQSVSRIICLISRREP